MREYSKITSFLLALLTHLVMTQAGNSQIYESEDFEIAFPPTGWSILNGNFSQGSISQSGISSCQNTQLIALLGLGRATIVSKAFDLRGRGTGDTANVRFGHINSSVLTLGQQHINVYVNDTLDISDAVFVGSVTPQLSYLTSTVPIPAAFNGPRNYIFFEITAPLLSLIPSIHIDNLVWTTFPLARADVKMFLEGPYDSGNMKNVLNSRGLLPQHHPYGSSPYNYNGNESVDSSFFSTHPQIVDWVLLDLRLHDTSSVSSGRRAAFIRNDGKIVDLDGVSPVTFSDVPETSYYIVVYHRNHIISMSSSSLNFGTQLTSYDFSTGANKYYGGVAKDLGGGVFGMYAGDPQNDGRINHADLNEESIQQSSLIYNKSDTNMDGLVDIEDYTPTDSNIGKVATVPFIE